MKTTKLWLQKGNGSKIRPVRRSDSRPGDHCDINPQKLHRFIQRPRTWPSVDPTDPKSGRKGKAGKVVVERARGTSSACPALEQGKRALSVAKQCRCTIANTLAADQCAQRSDGVTLLNAHGAGPTQHFALSGGRAVANPNVG